MRFDQVRIQDNLFDVTTMASWHVGPRLGANYALRTFKLGGIDKLDVAFDVFNALNGDTFQQFKSGGNQTYNANFGQAADGTIQGQSRQFARAGQVSVRVAF